MSSRHMLHVGVAIIASSVALTLALSLITSFTTSSAVADPPDRADDPCFNNPKQCPGTAPTSSEPTKKKNDPQNRETNLCLGDSSCSFKTLDQALTEAKKRWRAQGSGTSPILIPIYLGDIPGEISVGTAAVIDFPVTLQGHGTSRPVVKGPDKGCITIKGGVATYPKATFDYIALRSCLGIVSADATIRNSYVRTGTAPVGIGVAGGIQVGVLRLEGVTLEGAAGSRTGTAVTTEIGGVARFTNIRIRYFDTAVRAAGFAVNFCPSHRAAGEHNNVIEKVTVGVEITSTVDEPYTSQPSLPAAALCENQDSIGAGLGSFQFVGPGKGLSSIAIRIRDAVFVHSITDVDISNVDTAIEAVPLTRVDKSNFSGAGTAINFIAGALSGGTRAIPLIGSSNTFNSNAFDIATSTPINVDGARQLSLSCRVSGPNEKLTKELKSALGSVCDMRKVKLDYGRSN